METDNGKEEAFRNNLFRLNCVEIASEDIDNEYGDYPIRLVDGILDAEEEEEYIDYVCFSRGGMPNWKAYYDIKNLVETLDDIDSLENEGVKDLLLKIEKSFLMILFSKISVDKNSISNPFNGVIFDILRKLEFFFPEKEALLNFVLKIDVATIDKADALEAANQYEQIIKDENYFLDEERVLLEILIYYFIPGKKLLLDRIFDKIASEKDRRLLLEFLGNVEISSV